MREALAIIAEEGLAKVWQRHSDMHDMLWQGLEELGLQPLVKDPAHRLPCVNAIQVGAQQAPDLHSPHLWCCCRATVYWPDHRAGSLACLSHLQDSRQ